ncbi:flagellar biosynthesis anti-sigma factor FlgM [Thalassomonas sp. RHCl1]|uniref:flagellar biosynthesis anti-sigma factor FlgM n=1 Tax=Thalassomonas sp. RHCl1 TaxID=2995320 RepID=UPI00248D21EA|nr:flagellar biosynthesis anti-sigma factor FlgM [Thalassomonas sp. RHCl1]
MMKIVNNPLVSAGLNSQTSKPVGKESKESAPVPERTTKVDNFLDINNQLASSSDVDMEKVNQVRELIAEGNLTLDVDVLSDAILEMHRR